MYDINAVIAFHMMRLPFIPMLFLLALPAFAAAETLRWTDNSDNEEGFVIERRQGGGAWRELGRVGANVTRFIVPRPNLATCFRVRAYNKWGVAISEPVCGRSNV